jgi:hypothetical protein
MGILCKECAHVGTRPTGERYCEVYPDHKEHNGSFLALDQRCYYSTLDLYAIMSKSKRLLAVR